MSFVFLLKIPNWKILSSKRNAFGNSQWADWISGNPKRERWWKCFVYYFKFDSTVEPLITLVNIPTLIQKFSGIIIEWSSFKDLRSSVIMKNYAMYEDWPFIRDVWITEVNYPNNAKGLGVKTCSFNFRI